MSQIKDLPTLDRPREKAFRYGLEKLSDSELLAILIGSGYHGENASELANHLLADFQGLNGLASANIVQLKKYKGIKNQRALLIASCLELHKRLSQKEYEINEEEVDSEYLYNKYKTNLNLEKQEVLILIIVSRKKRIIYETTLYKGTENDVIFSYKEIWRELFIHQGHGFYLIHNHPSNSFKPSHYDKSFTSEIYRESRRINIPLIDHIIVGEGGYYSFLAMGHLTK